MSMNHTHQGARSLPVGRGRAQTDLAGAAQRRGQVDRLSARLEERDDPVRAALPGTIQHWNLNLNPPHTRNSGYLLRSSGIQGISIVRNGVAGHSVIPFTPFCTSLNHTT